MAASRETIIDRLRADHQRTLERLAELERRAQVGQADAPEPVFALMKTDVLDHMAAEDEFVYRFLSRGRAQWIDNSQMEHEKIREDLAALEAGGMPSALWLGRLREMKQLVERHIAEEERVVIPEIEMTYDSQKLRDLGDTYARWGRGDRSG